MLYLHQQQIIHMDLKPLNILISMWLHAKVSLKYLWKCNYQAAKLKLMSPKSLLCDCLGA